MLQVCFHPFPEIITARLLLRKITYLDAPAIFTLRSNKKVMQYIDRPMAETEEDAIKYIDIIRNALEKNEGITWGITLKKNTAEIIGTIGFWRLIKEHYRAEIGYMLSDRHQRRGIMQEAISAALDYGFNTMNLHSIEANVNPANEASQQLLEKNHFVREAYFKESFFHNGRFLDSVVYSLLKMPTN